MAREGRIKSMANLNRQMVPTGVEHNSHLKRVFKNYARLAIGQGRVYADGQPQMNSAQFHRLCQDAGFMEPEGGWAQALRVAGMMHGQEGHGVCVYVPCLQVC